MAFHGTHEVSINDVKFRVVQEQYQRRFLDVIRQQADSGSEPTEFSLNPNDLWRRAQTDWSKGAGQRVLDNFTSARRRFLSSEGLDPFGAPGRMTLAPRGVRLDANAGSLNYRKAVTTPAGIYVMQDSATTLLTFTSTEGATSAAPAAILDVVTVGSLVLVSVDGFGLYSNDPEWTLVNNLIPDVMAYVRGRLMVAVGRDLYNITDLTDPTPPASLTSSILDTGFEWTAIGETDSFILCAGSSGEQSYIYRVTLREDGTSLTPPVVAAQLPDGEFVRGIRSYLGLVCIATSEGVRVGVMNAGQLSYGPLVYSGSDVYDFEPEGQFVYFSRNGGVGRLNLAEFVEGVDLVPAYALHTTFTDARDVYSLVSKPTGCTMGAASTYSLVALQDTSGTDEGGLYELDTTKYVDSGEFRTGLITYGMADRKNFMFLEVVSKASGNNDKITVFVTDENGVEEVVGVCEGLSMTSLFLIDVTGEYISLRFVLEGGTETQTPTLERWTLRSLPVPKRTEQLIIPLDLRAQVLNMVGGTELRDPWAEYQALQELVRSGQVVSYTEFHNTFLATLENVQLGPDLDLQVGKDGWEGTAVVTLRIYDDYSEITSGADVDEVDSMFGAGQFGTGTFGDPEGTL